MTVPPVPHPTRRRLLKIAGLSLAAAGVAPAAAQTRPSESRRRVLRFAHVTDVHVQPELGAADGFTQCLQHLHAQPDPAELILNGGDCVFDSLGTAADRTDLQWDLWHKILSQHNTLPIESCLGNHDIWGWNKTKSSTTGAEPGWGKKRALDALGLAASYRSFDRAGWHFVLLDSIFPVKESYNGRLDDAQFAWLEADLKAVDTKTPVLVMSHIPILSVTPLLGKDVDKTGDFAFSAGQMHIDGKRIKALFDGYRNVKLAISGHQHLIDHVEYNGVSYLCNGAVCGSWWKGKNLGDCDAGYTMMNLFDDGSFEREYVTYGWTYRTS